MHLCVFNSFVQQWNSKAKTNKPYHAVAAQEILSGYFGVFSLSDSSVEGQKVS